MGEDEYTTWRAVCVAAYARDTVKTLRITAVVATERAAAQIEQMISRWARDRGQLRAGDVQQHELWRRIRP